MSAENLTAVEFLSHNQKDEVMSIEHTQPSQPPEEHQPIAELQSAPPLGLFEEPVRELPPGLMDWFMEEFERCAPQREAMEAARREQEENAASEQTNQEIKE